MKYVRSYTVLVICLAVVLTSTGCTAHLTRGEEMHWGVVMQKSGLYEPIPFKSKGVTSLLSILIPGTGHLYADEPGLAALYFLGNILWPFNILWTVPRGLQAAEVANKRFTIMYYQTGAYSDVVERLGENGKLPYNFQKREETDLGEVREEQ